MAPVRLQRPHFSGPIVWVGLCVVVGGVIVQMTKSGVDILALLAAAFVLLLLERTLGDWVADTLGPVPTALLFVAMAIAGVVFVSSESGRGRASRFFAAAEARGYHTVYFKFDRPPADGGIPPVRIARVPDTMKAVPPRAASPASITAGSSSAGPAPVNPAPVAAAPVPPVPSRGPASGVRLSRLYVVPEVATIGEGIALRVDVASNGDGTLPAVAFSIDGHAIGTAAPSSSGAATLEWRTRVPGQYVVRARLPSGDGASALLTVLPGAANSKRRGRSVQ